jgi:peptidoglycan/xylan/chitin deacetylase (PgdA/CDA1 family)
MARFVFAGPVTTVPWNGHTGAASFTYDDARTSQIPNLLPQLDALKIKATFFIAVTGTGGDFEAKKSAWVEAAKSGHELGNHTKAHVNVPADPGAATVISEMAKYLRALDPVVESVTFAYPNCNVNGKTGIGAENFISRGCGQVSYAWGNQPADWMNIQGLILQPGNVNTAVTMLNGAKTNNTWVVTIVHDVKENPDTYSLTPADNKKMLEAGVNNNLWIDTYQNVAAYYRAHFTMDAATATTTANGWKLTWTSPHPKMPKSVKLRVKLDAATFGSGFVVEQGGQSIQSETDGTYVVDFMKLSLDVLNKATGTLSAHIPKRLQTKVTRHGIEFYGTLGTVRAQLMDVRGHILYQGQVSQGLIPIPSEQIKGLAFLTLSDLSGRISVRAQINPLQ